MVDGSGSEPPLPTGSHTGIAGRIEGVVLRAQREADRLQARHAVFGFPYAVFKKYADDEGSRLAAQITYYGFLAIFPLSILFLWALSQIFEDDPAARDELLRTLVPEDYVDVVVQGYDALPTGGAPLAIALIGLVLTSTGLVFAFYAAMNQIWAVPYRHRFGFFPRYLRVISMVFVLGVGAFVVAAMSIATGSLSGLGGLSRVLLGVATILVAFAVLAVSHWALTARRLRLAEIWLGCLLGSVVTLLVLAVGGQILGGLVQQSSPVYGAFAAIVGVFALAFLVAQAIIFSVEASSVRAWELWPRGLDINLLFPADQRAFTLLAHMDERMPSQRNSTDFDARGNEDPKRQPLDEMDRRQPGEPSSPYA